MAIEKITIPDFGDVQKITVVEVFIAAGDKVEEETSLIALESEKAVMDIPSPYAGVITEVQVKEEDVVNSGDVIALVDTDGDSAAKESADEEEKPADRKEDKTEGKEEKIAEKEQETAEKEEETADKEKKAPAEEKETEDTTAEQEPDHKADKPAEKTDQKKEQKQQKEPEQPEKPEKPEKDQRSEQVFHATPSVRALAREKQIDLAAIAGTGPHNRIRKEDLLATGQKPEAPSFIDQPPLEDFSKYGQVEEMALGRIQKISGPQLHRSWMSIPHVTHFDEADITELEQFRKELNAGLAEDQPSYSPLVFVVKAVAATLQQFPLFNCSLMRGGEKVILKKYYHLAIAVDTPKGLVVPVVKDADQLGIKDIAVELKRLSTSARAGKLAIPDIQGATFTISSLGGIGGTGFTPIINSPQVAILGLSRNFMKPIWDGEQFTPRLILPFSVSYDHRVVDGAEAARFCKALRMNIEDLKRVLL